MSHQEPTRLYNVLKFFHDEEDSCALTILVQQVRFHIIADVDELGTRTASGSTSSKVLEEYLRLLANLKNTDPENGCGDRDETTDSGIGMGTTHTEDTSTVPKYDEAKDALQEWIVSPLRSELERSNDTKVHSSLTLDRWYKFPTRYFQLEAGKDQLDAVELEPDPALDERMAKLYPRLTPVPRYISEIGVPWYSSQELQVLHCSGSPPPYHPSIVELSTPEGGSVTQQKLFFKSVDNFDPQPTKREISLLDQISRKGLHDKIRCPRLIGIVARDGAEKGASIMGFLQSLIPDPTPLTEKFDSSVSQAQREKWAREAEGMKSALHEHGIVWGDAKGDNFVVDSSGELWIIDFGGSYTEGWVEPDVAETMEGDNMGVEKIVNALQDPKRNVERGSEDAGEPEDGETETQDAVDGKKRNHAGESQRESKRQRRQSTSESTNVEEPTYCYCGGPSSGIMVGCDGDDCKMEWFHIECAGLKDSELPAEDDAWYCRECEPV